MKPHVICHMMSPLDGRLHVTSHPGEGTTLRAEIPCEW